MDKKSKLKFISYNIKSFGADKIDTVRDLLKNCDFLLVQEIWKYDRIFIETVKKEFPGYECIIRSPNNEAKESLGRLSGGVGIIYKNNIDCNVEEIKCVSNRLCALKIVINELDIMLINVYMPCDTGIIHGELIEYNDVLAELNQLMMCSCSQHVIIAGDLNTDLSRNNAQTKSLLSFADEGKLCLCINHEESNVPYTHIPIRGEYSTIDHFLTSLNLCDAVKVYESLFIHNNFSDHIPVILELDINISYIQMTKNCRIRKTNWDKCNAENIDNYKSCIDNRLSKLDYNLNALSCRNVKCKIHSEHIRYVYDSIIEICDDASNKYLPKTGDRQTNKNSIPGWNEKVKPYLDKSLFWHEIWVQCGKPNQGEVARIRRMTRARYHLAIKSALKSHIQIRNEKMGEAISSNNDRNLWEEVKKMNKSNKLLPEAIDNVKGSDNIANLFFDKNNDLFNSVSYEKDEMKDLKSEIDDLINANIDTDCNDTLEFFKFNVQNVIDAINEMKSGKIEESGLYTDHFKHAPHRLYVLLTCLFNSMLVHGIAPNNMLIGTMTPIIKDGRESHKNSSNYRTLTIGTCLSKVFDILVIKNQSKVFNTSEMQFGFQNGSSTTMCTFMVQQTISHYVKNNSNVNVLMLDASKAFDRVQYIHLFKKLIGRGMCPIIIRLLLNMYTQQKLQVKWNGVISDQFNVSNGVRQGGIMSPLLFRIYIDELLLDLKNSGVGCVVGNYYCGAFGYADDIILLCPAITGIEHMIQICEVYADKHFIRFNGKKSKLLIFGEKTDDPKISIKGELVPLCTNAIYLGNMLSTVCNSDIVNEGIKHFNINFNIFLSKFGTCKILVKDKLFNQYCCSYYGSQLWPLYNQDFKNVCTKWRKAIRRIWELPFDTHCNLLPIISEQKPIEIALTNRYIKFLKSLLESKNCIVSYMARLQSQNCQSIFGQNARHIMLNNNISWYDLETSTTNVIKEQIYDKYIDSVQTEQFMDAKVIRDMILRNGSFNDWFLTEEQSNFLIFLCTS